MNCKKLVTRVLNPAFSIKVVSYPQGAARMLQNYMQKGITTYEYKTTVWLFVPSQFIWFF